MNNRIAQGFPLFQEEHVEGQEDNRVISQYFDSDLREFVSKYLVNS